MNILWDEHVMPQQILEDEQLCASVLNHARGRLRLFGIIPPRLKSLQGTTSQLILATDLGDETRNIDMFTLITPYIRLFAAHASQANLQDIQVVPCEGEGGVRPNRKIQRGGRDRVIIEHKGKAAFDKHIKEIQIVVKGAQGQGTRVQSTGNETGGRSIILKLAKHMISTCSWSIGYGGDRYMLFYMEKNVQEDGPHYRMLACGPHDAFAGPFPMISVLIALLLKNEEVPSTQHLTPFQPTKYVIPAVGGMKTRQQMSKKRGV